MRLTSSGLKTCHDIVSVLRQQARRVPEQRKVILDNSADARVAHVEMPRVGACSKREGVEALRSVCKGSMDH
jgi:hypothetical protein